MPAEGACPATARGTVISYIIGVCSAAFEPNAPDCKTYVAGLDNVTQHSSGVRPRYRVFGLAAAKTLASALVTTSVLGAIPSAPSGLVSADRLAVVDCLLPGQVRQLGGSMTFLSPRRPARAPVYDCEIRGGEYTAYDRANYATALKVWLAAAEKGDAKAQVYVGEIYEKGLGIAPDYAQAAAWYEKAAKQGDSQGLNHSAYLYEQGLGVPKDPLRALNLYRSAAGLTSDDLTFVSEVNAVRAEAQSKIDALSAQLEERTQSVEELSQQMEAGRTQLEQTRAAAASARRDAAQLRQRVAKLQETAKSESDQLEVSVLTAALKDREQKLAQSQAEIATLESKSSEQDTTLRTRLAEAEKEDVKLRQELGAARAEEEAVKSQLQTAQSRADAMDREVKNLRSQVKLNEDSVRSAEEKLRKQPAATNPAQKAEAAALAETVAEQRAQLERQKTVIAGLETQRQALGSQIDQLQSAVKTIKAENTTVVAQNADMKAQTAEMKVITTDALKAKDQAVATADALRAQLVSAQAELAQKSKAVSDLSATLEASKRQIIQDQERLKANEDRLRNQPLPANASAKEKAETAALAATVADQRSQLEKQKAAIAGLETQRQTLGSQVTQLNSSVASMKAQNTDIMKDKDKVAASAETLRAQLASAQADVLRKTVAANDLAAVVAADKRQIAQDQERLKTNIARSGGSDADVQRLNKELAQREVSLEKQQIEIAALTDIIKQNQNTIGEFKQQLAGALVSRGSVPISATTVAAAAPALGSIDLGFGTNWALIIGNSDYAHMPGLKTATKDAQDIEKLLSDRYGYQGHTKLLLNATREQMMNALNDVVKAARDTDNLIIYYAGHGALDETNLRGYWLPVDAEQGNPANWISDRNVTDMIALMSARHILVVADSCYSGAMLRSSNVRLESKGTVAAQVQRMRLLAKLRSRTVLTSGGNEPVLDNGSEGHSIFARAFIELLSHNNEMMEASALYNKIFDPVHDAAKRVGMMTGLKISQSPRYAALGDAGHMNGDFIFVPKGPSASRAPGDLLPRVAAIGMVAPGIF